MSALMPGHAWTGNTGMPQSAGTDGESVKHFYTRGKKEISVKGFYVTFTDSVVFLQAVSVLSFKRCMYIHCGPAGTRKWACEDRWSYI